MSRASLAEFEVLLAVARFRGFRPAARALGMSSSAVSQIIAALEAQLGVRLFDRTTRSVALSAAGEQFLARIQPALATIRTAMDEVDQHREHPTGVLRLNTSLNWAQMVLAPLLLEYLRRYPQIQLELVTEGRLVDLVAEGFDAGIRNIDALPPDMVAIPIAPALRSIVVAAPGYFADRGRPQLPADLLGHQCIRARMPSGAIYRWELGQAGHWLELDVPGRLTLDEPGLMRQAALAGMGLALIGENLVAADVAAGRLVQVLQDWSPSYPGIALYYPGRRHAPAKLRALIELTKEYSGTGSPVRRHDQV